MNNFNHFTKSALALALIAAGSANATSFKAEVTPEQVSAYNAKEERMQTLRNQKIAEIKQVMTKKGVPQAMINQVTNAMQNGDDENLEIETSTFFKFYGCEYRGNSDECDRQPADMSNNTIDIAFVYDPHSLGLQRTKGAFYRFVADTVDRMNQGLIDSKVNTRVRLADFSQIDISDWYEKQQQALSDSDMLWVYELDKKAYVPENLSFDFPSYDFLDDDGDAVKGLSGFAWQIWEQAHGYYINAYQNNFTKRLKNSGADTFMYITRESKTLCGAAGGQVMQQC
ncbi:hypothetical protein [Shewanella aestuarii]|uniref:Uncharacterized protein n=1 Tax=Shewanella aestuarii TaxID=1028752 RepID=A0A6G9QQ04_9GAMM|nr:hypothetical protein [Shewanella aestuarii]QIR16674.1 hypothetical protein HBH39_19570 [Shewanella aestuarii]